MPRKGARKRCIRLLNEFKCVLIDSRAPSSFVQAVKDGNHSALLFSDLDKSVQYVKKRIKKGSYVSHRHDPLLLHVFSPSSPISSVRSRGFCFGGEQRDTGPTRRRGVDFSRGHQQPDDDGPRG